MTDVDTRPFGAASRAELLDQYFGDRTVDAGSAWVDVYRLLLWIDRTTGLAHCYESDKSQPGRHWYARSLRFHAWLSEALGVEPAELEGRIDWLFRQAMLRLADAVERQREVRQAAAVEQQEEFRDLQMPQPGPGGELIEILERLSPNAAPESTRRAAEEVAAYFGAENRRKNLLGEGFEDVLTAIIARLPGPGPEVEARRLLHDLPGFREPPEGEKPRRVDLGVLTRDNRRILVSAKWSVRADREEQFGVDYDNYARMEVSGESFEFVLVTNEFDAARLLSATRRRAGIHPLFTSIVHVNPEGVLATYAGGGRGAAEQLPDVIDGRQQIISLGEWLESL